VTTARDLGARAFLDVTVRDAIASGMACGPRLITAGRPITVTGGHCWFMGGECDTVDDVRTMVRLHHKMGVDAIKVMSTGGFMTTGSAPWHARFTFEQLGAAVEEAHRLGKRVAAHAHGYEGIRRAVEAGVDTIEHCSFAHPDGHHGVEPQLAWLGMPLDEVLHAATACAASALGVGNVTGRLAAGMDADVIAVHGDPRTDLSALADLRFVATRGTPFVPDALPSLELTPAEQAVRRERLAAALARPDLAVAAGAGASTGAGQSS
jgi:imidazolonepropionase-like amidohydrolase